jgi:hypothetical protein
MKYFTCFCLILLQTLTTNLSGQDLLNLDLLKVKDNFLDIDYFNDIWFKSKDINKEDAGGYVRSSLPVHTDKLTLEFIAGF